MKIKKFLQKSNITRTIALLLMTIAAIYTAGTIYEPAFNLFAQNDSTGEGDTTVGGDSYTLPSGDVSQMFNERGFYSSNSTSFDENEMINDYNGNLMHEIPLYKFKGDGDVNLDLKLVYNGSVNHQVILTNKANFNDQSTKYNVTAPEWMLSLNGICIQTLNFESYLLTQPGTSGNLNGNDIKKLIPGYHFDDKMKSLGTLEKDRI